MSGASRVMSAPQAANEQQLLTRAMLLVTHGDAIDTRNSDGGHGSSPAALPGHAGQRTTLPPCA
jgi:hypothetical protein